MNRTVFLGVVLITSYLAFLPLGSLAFGAKDARRPNVVVMQKTVVLQFQAFLR